MACEALPMQVYFNLRSTFCEVMQSIQFLWQHIFNTFVLLVGIAINQNLQELVPKSFDLKSIPTLFNLAAAACLWQNIGSKFVLPLGIAIILTLRQLITKSFDLKSIPKVFNPAAAALSGQTRHHGHARHYPWFGHPAPQHRETVQLACCGVHMADLSNNV